VTDKPTVYEAVNAVMAAVQAIGKGDRNTQQNYSFRGVDAVVNAVGPVLREHGVILVPLAAEIESERYETKSKTPMRGVTVKVGYRFYGPAGDYIDATTYGEAADSGDKAVSKAMSVAYRVCLLQALCIPTDERDPDADSHERAMPAVEAVTTIDLGDLMGRIALAETVGQLRGLWGEASMHHREMQLSGIDWKTVQDLITERKTDLEAAQQPTLEEAASE
jgi:hypothetical protein